MRFSKIKKILKDGNEEEIKDIFSKYNLVISEYTKFKDYDELGLITFRLKIKGKSNIFINFQIEYVSAKDQGLLTYYIPIFWLGGSLKYTDTISDKIHFDIVIKTFINMVKNHIKYDDISVSGYKG